MAKYNPPQYDEQKYRAGINTDFYTNSINQYTADANAERQRQIGEAQKTQQSALKQAYVARLQNQKRMNQSLAQSGIRGGATETANLNLANQYGQARSAINTDYANSVNQINQATDQNIRDYRMDMESRAEQYRQEQANARWTADREDYMNQYNAQVEYFNNYYADFYSGYSKKQAQKALKKAQEQEKKATGMEKIRLQQKVRGIQLRLGTIANK